MDGKDRSTSYIKEKGHLTQGMEGVIATPLFLNFFSHIQDMDLFFFALSLSLP